MSYSNFKSYQNELSHTDLRAWDDFIRRIRINFHPIEGDPIRTVQIDNRELPVGRIIINFGMLTRNIAFSGKNRSRSPDNEGENG